MSRKNNNKQKQPLPTMIPLTPPHVPKINLTNPSPTNLNVSALLRQQQQNQNQNQNNLLPSRLLFHPSSMQTNSTTTTTSTKQIDFLLFIRWPCVILSVIIVFFVRDFLAQSVLSGLDSFHNFFFPPTAPLLPLGCQTERIGDAIALIVILFHHEITLLLCLLTAVFVDTLFSYGIYLLKQSSSTTTTTAASSSYLPFIFTPRSVSNQVLSVLPEGAQSRLMIVVLLLLVFGVDIGEANIRFMSLSVSQPLSFYNNNNHRHQHQHQHHHRSEKSDNNNNQNLLFVSATPPLVARNKHLECELSHAIASSGVVVISGTRGVGKSTSTRFVLSNRSGFYCDVHRAATAETLEATVEKCIEQHNLLNHVPNAWQSLSLALRHFLSNWMWKVAWFENLASSFFVASYWQVYGLVLASNAVEQFSTSFFSSIGGGKNNLNNAPPSSTSTSNAISSPSFLAKRCAANKQEKSLVFVLDGVRDSTSGHVLGLLDSSPNILATMQSIANIATIVVVAASDDTLSDLNELDLQFISGMSSRVAFVTASPAEEEDVAELYSIFGKESLNGFCDKEVSCSRKLFGGAFEYVRNWANMLSPRPDVKNPETELSPLCNAALRTVVATSYSIMDSTSGWQMGTSHHVTTIGRSSASSGNDLRSINCGFGCPKSSAFFSMKDSLSFRLRALHFMLQIAADEERSVSDCDQDVVDRFTKAQLVYEETVQFPLCRTTKSDLENGKSAASTTMMRAVAPRLFNATLAQILIRKESHIREAIEILNQSCGNKNDQVYDDDCTKSISGFVADLKRRIFAHKQEWWMESDEGKELKNVCGNAVNV